MIEIATSLLPVFIFLLLLIYFDSYKLVKMQTVLATIAYGGLAAVGCYFVNKFLINELDINLKSYSRYFAPIIEESFKVSLIVIFILKKKIGFMIDAMIYGFAVGAGFSLVENIYYLGAIEHSSIFLWIIRGFGTAVMHGGTVAIFSILSKNLFDMADDINLIKRFNTQLPKFSFITNILLILPGLLAAILIHSFFNHLLIPVIALTLLQLIILPSLTAFIFYRSEMALKNWMEEGLDNEVRLLEQIDDGVFSESNAGKYLTSLEEKFSGIIIADMLCLIKVHLELSIKAKGVLLMKKVGLPVIIEDEVKEKFEELKYLEKSIGKTGKLAVAPIFSRSTKDLWQLYMLGFK